MIKIKPDTPKIESGPIFNVRKVYHPLMGKVVPEWTMSTITSV